MKRNSTALRTALTTTTLALLALGAGQAMASTWGNPNAPTINQALANKLAAQRPSLATICAQGRITKLEQTAGSSERGISIATESAPAQPGAYDYVEGIGHMTTLTSYSGAEEGFKDHLSLLQFAAANKLAVQITSNNGICKTHADNVTVTLCTDGTSCAIPR